MLAEANLAKIAERNGWVLNPDPKALANVIKGLNKMKERHGDYYCPCRVKKVREHICPCIHVVSEIENDGRCHCRLFFRKNS